MTFSGVMAYTLRYFTEIGKPACVPTHNRLRANGTYWLQVAQLSQRDRAAGWVSFGQRWKTIFCRLGLSSTTVT